MSLLTSVDAARRWMTNLAEASASLASSQTQTLTGNSDLTDHTILCLLQNLGVPRARLEAILTSERARPSLYSLSKEVSLQ